jgi:hypothetical protein
VRTNAFHRQSTARLPVMQTLLLLGAAGLSASVSAGTSVKGAWVDGASRKQTFSRILVVGISPNVDQRCPFERALVARLKNESTFAVASCDVVATSLISKAWSVTEGNGNDTRADGFYKATDAYYGYYGTVVAADFQTMDSVTTLKGQAHITSKVYETQGATVVYTVDTSVKNVVSGDAGLIEITIPIGKRMRKDGLIR